MLLVICYFIFIWDLLVVGGIIVEGKFRKPLLKSSVNTYLTQCMLGESYYQHIIMHLLYENASTWEEKNAQLYLLFL